MHDHKVYILLGTVANDTIILNLLVSRLKMTNKVWIPNFILECVIFPQNGEPLQVTNTALHIKDTVKSMRGNLLTLVPDVRSMLNRLKRELLEPVIALDSHTKTSETQTTTQEHSRRPVPDPDILPHSTPDVLRVQPRYLV